MFHTLCSLCHSNQPLTATVCLFNSSSFFVAIYGTNIIEFVDIRFSHKCWEITYLTIENTFQGVCHDNQTSSETDNHADETLFENKTSTNTETHDNWHGKAIYNLHWQLGANNDADVDHVREQVSACHCLDYRCSNQFIRCQIKKMFPIQKLSLGLV